MESEDALLGSYDSEASANDSQSETILSEDDDLGAEKATLESGKPFPKDVTKIRDFLCQGDEWLGEGP